MRTTRRHWLVLPLLIVLSTVSVAGQNDAPPAIGFGLGGPSAGLFLPDLGPLNELLVDHGFAPLTGAIITAGGRGRGGVLGGTSAGGLGWAGSVESRAGDLRANLAVGFGGIELGHVAGGDDRSLLTVGVVLGMSGVGLRVRDVTVVTSADSGPTAVLPTASDLHAGRMVFAVEPFVSMQVQPFGILGFEIHLGWLVPLVGFQWGNFEAAVRGRPVLDLGGATIGFSVTWGAIGAVRPRDEEDAATTRHVVPFDASCIEIVNPVGLVDVSVSDEASAVAGSAPTVEVLVTRRARSAALREQIAVDIAPGECGLRIATESPRRWGWSVDYEITVPPGTEVRVDQGAGDVKLTAVDGPTVVELGAGEVRATGFRGETLAIDCGVGDVTVDGSDASTTTISIGTGDANVFLSGAPSLVVSASSGVGEVTIGPFADHTETSASGFGNDLVAILGAGAGSLTVDVGVGTVSVREASR
ncbi:MAG: DUF4097 family beta strand repeat protein [Candidatus Bipolaricaulota bacterium]|nr:MAG: DUF4097 family beta strand repeat protein [Candidatus Bipolaricaulota bacterium]